MDALAKSDLGDLARDVSNTWQVIQGFGDLTGLEADLQAVTAAMQGVSLATMQTDVNAILTQVQSLGNVSGLSTSVTALATSLQGANLQQMNTDLSSVVSLVQTVNGNVSTMRGDTTTIKADVASVRTAVAALDLGGTDMSALDRIEKQLGTPTSRDRNTFFGKLSAISTQLSSTESSSSDAAKKAQTAKTEAANAASGIAGLRAELEKGEDADPVKVMELLNQVIDSLTATQGIVEKIPVGFDMDALEQRMLEVVARMRRLAKGDGLPEPEPKLVAIPTVPAVEAGEPGTEAGAVVMPPAGEPGASRASIDAMNQNITEIESTVRILKQLMEEKFLTPQVFEDLIKTP